MAYYIPRSTHFYVEDNVLFCKDDTFQEVGPIKGTLVDVIVGATPDKYAVLTNNETQTLSYRGTVYLRVNWMIGITSSLIVYLSDDGLHCIPDDVQSDFVIDGRVRLPGGAGIYSKLDKCTCVAVVNGVTYLIRVTSKLEVTWVNMPATDVVHLGYGNLFYRNGTNKWIRREGCDYITDAICAVPFTSTTLKGRMAIVYPDRIMVNEKVIVATRLTGRCAVCPSIPADITAIYHVGGEYILCRPMVPTHIAKVAECIMECQVARPLDEGGASSRDPQVARPLDEGGASCYFTDTLILEYHHGTLVPINRRTGACNPPGLATLTGVTQVLQSGLEVLVKADQYYLFTGNKMEVADSGIYDIDTRCTDSIRPSLSSRSERTVMQQTPYESMITLMISTDPSVKMKVQFDDRTGRQSAGDGATRSLASGFCLELRDRFLSALGEWTVATLADAFYVGVALRKIMALMGVLPVHLPASLLSAIRRAPFSVRERELIIKVRDPQVYNHLIDIRADPTVAEYDSYQDAVDSLMPNYHSISERVYEGFVYDKLQVLAGKNLATIDYRLSGTYFIDPELIIRKASWANPELEPVKALIRTASQEQLRNLLHNWTGYPVLVSNDYSVRVNVGSGNPSVSYGVCSRSMSIDHVLLDHPDQLAAVLFSRAYFIRG